MAAGDRRSRPLQHIHFSMLHGIAVFLIVVLIGSVWKLGALHLIANNPTGESGKWGRMMLFQYGG